MQNDGQRGKSIPLTILTGFLGSGKTTMLNRILNGSHGLKVAVLVNDFGSINIDSELVVGMEEDVISLANGCICCTVRDDMIQAVMEVSRRPEKPQYVIMEASGVADPHPLAVTFSMPEIRDRVRLDSITCIIDAEQVFEHPEQAELKIKQAAFSDLMVVNKVDLVGEAQLEAIRQWVGKRLYRYRLIETVQCQVPLDVLLSVGRFDPSATDGSWFPLASPAGDEQSDPGHHDSHQDHGRAALNFSTWSYQTDRPLSLEKLEEVAAKMPNNVYRLKGIVHSVEHPEMYSVLQVVGKRVDISQAGPWNGREPKTRLVAIGAPGVFDNQEIKTRFDACKA